MNSVYTEVNSKPDMESTGQPSGFLIFTVRFGIIKIKLELPHETYLYRIFGKQIKEQQQKSVVSD